MNWQKLVAELIDSGLTQTGVAEKAECSQNLISDLLHGKRGKRLTYEIGVRLVALHDELTTKAGVVI